MLDVDEYDEADWRQFVLGAARMLRPHLTELYAHFSSKEQLPLFVATLDADVGWWRWRLAPVEEV